MPPVAGVDPDALLRRAERAARALGRAATAAARLNRSHMRGIHGRRKPGEGEDFWQFRDYQSNDPAERIDWRRSARGDQLYIREREWDTAQTLYLWVDRSKSMDFTSDDGRPQKAERAAVIALALASIFANGGERVALLGAAGRTGGGRAAVRSIAELIAGGFSPALATARSDQGPLSAGSHVALIGDLLDPVDVLRKSMAALAGPGVTGHLIQILDPAEVEFPYRGRVTFEGLEGEEPETLGRVEDLADAYQRRLAAHNAAIIDQTRALGWTYLRHVTDMPMTTTLVAAKALISGGEL